MASLSSPPRCLDFGHDYADSLGIQFSSFV